ncbi:MAG: TetR/AcrR family transcriptional regulator [Chloroflexota bacterium]
MGRKSLAPERKNQILDALEKCIVSHGLAGATLQRVAEEAGVKLSMIPHYFGNRDGMMQAMIERFVNTYRRDFANMLDYLPQENRVEALLDMYFSDQLQNYRPQDTVIVGELMTLAERDPNVRQFLIGVFQLFEDVYVTELQRAFDDTDGAQHRKLAYLFTALWYGHSSLIWLGFDKERHVWAREATGGLMELMAKAGD